MCFEGIRRRFSSRQRSSTTNENEEISGASPNPAPLAAPPNSGDTSEDVGSASAPIEASVSGVPPTIPLGPIVQQVEKTILGSYRSVKIYAFVENWNCIVCSKCQPGSLNIVKRVVNDAVYHVDMEFELDSSQKIGWTAPYCGSKQMYSFDEFQQEKYWIAAANFDEGFYAYCISFDDAMQADKFTMVLESVSVIDDLHKELALAKLDKILKPRHCQSSQE